MSTAQATTAQPTEPVIKKRRVGTRPKKGEKELKEILEPFKIEGDKKKEAANAWIAYKRATHSLKEKQKAAKEQKEENLEPAAKVEKLVREAKRHNTFANTLVRQGKEPQANGLKERSDKKFQEAQEIFGKLDASEKDKIPKSIKIALNTQDITKAVSKTNATQVKELETSLIKVAAWVKEEHEDDAKQVLCEAGVE